MTDTRRPLDLVRALPSHFLLAVALLCTLAHPTRAANARGQCTFNLRRIGQAIESYQAAYGRPLADIVDKQGRPLLSWRVQLLPFLEGQVPYSEFHLDEPWDSPHNIRLVEKIPRVYMCPAHAVSREGACPYLAVRSAGDGLPKGTVRGVGQAPPRPAVIVLEADIGHEVAWTKPEDLDYDPADPTRGLVRRHGGAELYGERGGLALFDDGNVRFLSPDGDPVVVRKVLAAGDESIRFNLPWYAALSVPRVRSLMIPWLLFCLIAVGGAVPVFVRLLRTAAVSPGEILWLAVGLALLAHAVAVACCYRYHLLPSPNEDWRLQSLFWTPPALFAALTCLYGATVSRFPVRWRVLFVVAIALFGLDALDALSPLYRSLDDSFMTAFPPVFAAAVGIGATWLSLKFGAIPAYSGRRFLHWAGICVFLLPSVWYARCYSLGLPVVYEMFLRIRD